MKDGKEYTMTIDGVTQSFTVTDGKVATVGFNKTTVPCDTDTEIKVVAKDEKGVIVYEQPYGAVDASKYTVEFKSTAAGFTQSASTSKIRLVKVGDTATAKVTWKSGKFDSTGKAEGNIDSGDVTITAVDPVAVDNFGMKIAEGITAPANQKFSKLDAGNTIKLGATSGYAFFLIKDIEGNQIKRYADYTLESTNPGVVTLVGGFTPAAEGQYVRLAAGSIGTAYINVKKAGSVVASLEVTVVAKADLASLTVSTNNITMSNSPDVDAKTTVYTTLKDQYGKNFAFSPAKNVTVDLLSVSGADDNSGTYKAVKAAIAANNAGAYFTIANNTEVTFNAKNLNKGVYEYTISAKNGSNVEFAQKVIVTIQAPAATGAVEETLAIEVSAPTFDMACVDNSIYNKTIDISVAVMSNGVKRRTVVNGTTIAAINTPVAKTVAGISYTVSEKNCGKVVTWVSSEAAFNNNIHSWNRPKVTTDGATLSVIARTGAATSTKTTETKKMSAGTYTVAANVYYTDGTSQVLNDVSFVVTDSQVLGTVSVKDSAPVKGAQVGATIQKALIYNGYDYAVSDYTREANQTTSKFTDETEAVITSVDGTSSIANIANFEGKAISALTDTMSKGDTVNIKVINLNVKVVTNKGTVWVPVRLDYSAAPLSFTAGDN